MAFRKEPTYTHGTTQQTAVLLVNLGTPEAPTAPAVRRYLKQFLSDPRVVEIPRAIWATILHGIILPFRSGKSAAKYASIWGADGSPLKVHTEKQTTLLRGYLGERGHQVQVAYAMRYGSPSVPQVLQQLQEQGCTRILVVPAYPQYAGSTTASVFDAVFAHYAGQRNVPELRMVKHYHDHESYIEALKRSVLAHWEAHGRPDKLVMSFHGVPKRTLELGDPYHCECYKTARLLATQLGLTAEQYVVTFQSRFGKAQGRMAAALYRPHPEATGAAGCPACRHHVPRFCVGLPGNPGRDRHGSPAGFSRCRWARIPLHTLLERKPGVDPCPDRYR